MTGLVAIGLGVLGATGLAGVGGAGGAAWVEGGAVDAVKAGCWQLGS